MRFIAWHPNTRPILKKAMVLCFCLACLLVIGLFGLTSCHKAAPAEPPLLDGFSGEITVVSGDFTVSGVLSRPARGQMTWTLSQPATLDGLTLIWDGTQLSAAWHGLSLALPDTLLPNTSLLKAVAGALDNAATLTDALPNAVGGTVTLTGRYGNDAFSLTADAQTGFLTTLTIPSRDLTVTFRRVAPLTEPAG